MPLQPQLPVPAVFINAPVVSLSEADAPGGIALSAPLQLWGPFNDVPTDPMPVPVLRLAGRATPLFNLTGTGQVFITRVILDATTNGSASSTSPGARAHAGSKVSSFCATAASAGVPVYRARLPLARVYSRPSHVVWPVRLRVSRLPHCRRDCQHAAPCR